MNSITRRLVLSRILPAGFLGFFLVKGTRGVKAAADQPHMQAALNALRTARSELDIAEADKGGHRVKALNLVKDAISEVEKGIGFDRRH